MIITALVRPKNLTHLCFFKNSLSLCTSKAHAHFPSFLLHFSTVPRPTFSDFLLHNQHFSPETASQVDSVLTHLRNPEKSDSVLLFLKEFGFSNDVVEKLVKSRLALLSTNLEKTIKPRFKIFQDLGFSTNSIARVMSNDPWIFKRSLKNLVPNVEFLKSCGVTMDQIMSAMSHFRRFLLYKQEDMKRFVDKVDEMGLSRGSKMFIHGVRIISSMNEITWEQKLRLFRDLGFSDDDIKVAFRNTPLVFTVSDEKLKEVKELIRATGKYEMSCFVNNPVSFMYSIEKRYKPRLQVLEVLESKNLIEKWPCFAKLCRMSNKMFYDKYVRLYLDEVGDLYNGRSE